MHCAKYTHIFFTRFHLFLCALQLQEIRLPALDYSLRLSPFKSCYARDQRPLFLAKGFFSNSYTTFYPFKITSDSMLQFLNKSDSKKESNRIEVLKRRDNVVARCTQLVNKQWALHWNSWSTKTSIVQFFQIINVLVDQLFQWRTHFFLTKCVRLATKLSFLFKSVLLFLISAL